jgi:hypothetical protein
MNSTNHSSTEHEKDRTMPTKRMTDKKLIAAEARRSTQSTLANSGREIFHMALYFEFVQT